MNRIFASLLLGGLLLPNVVCAAAPIPLDERTKIGAVDIKAGTVEFVHTNESGTITTKYVFAPDVVIHLQGKTVTLGSIKSGLHVHLFTLSSTMSDPGVIEELDLDN